MSEGTWQRCVGHLQEELPAQQFNTWIRPLRLEVGDGWIRLLAPNRFVRDWVNDRFFARIRELVSEFSPEEMPINIELAVADRQPPPVSVPGSPASRPRMQLPSPGRLEAVRRAPAAGRGRGIAHGIARPSAGRRIGRGIGLGRGPIGSPQLAHLYSFGNCFSRSLIR